MFPKRSFDRRQTLEPTPPGIDNQGERGMPDTTADCPAPGVVRDLLKSDFERVARDGYIAAVAGRSVRVYRERAISHSSGDTVRVTGELLWRQPIPDARETVEHEFSRGNVAP